MNNQPGSNDVNPNNFGTNNPKIEDGNNSAETFQFGTNMNQVASGSNQTVSQPGTDDLFGGGMSSSNQSDPFADMGNQQ